MAPTSNTANKFQLDFNFNGAKTLEILEEQNPPILLPNQPNDILLFSLDIGGSLIKLVYFSRDEEPLDGGDQSNSDDVGGILHFVKFERTHLDECLDFILSKLQKRGMVTSSMKNARIRATGGGAFAFADIFKERLDAVENVDELASVVAGANFLLQSIPNEAHMRVDGRSEFIAINENDLFPYLLVIIGTAIGMIKVTSNDKYELITGTHVGGGTIFGLVRLLIECESFDNYIELSERGDCGALDLTVGDVYGEAGYAKINVPSSVIAASFGKVGSQGKLSNYKVEDIAASLANVFASNITHISYLVAKLMGHKRVFYGGSYICGRSSIMDSISRSLSIWSHGEVQAIFLRHEGFLGALGALLVDDKLECSNITINT